MKNRNPKPTVPAGKGRNPIRVIIDGRLRISPDSNVVRRSTTRTIIYTSTPSAKKYSSKVMRLRNNGIEVFEIKSSHDNLLSVKSILSHLCSMGIASVLVEGGSFTFQQFLTAGLADKMYIFIAPKIFGY